MNTKLLEDLAESQPKFGIKWNRSREWPTKTSFVVPVLSVPQVTRSSPFRVNPGGEGLPQAKPHEKATNLLAHGPYCRSPESRSKNSSAHWRRHVWYFLQNELNRQLLLEKGGPTSLNLWHVGREKCGTHTPGLTVENAVFFFSESQASLRRR